MSPYLQNYKTAVKEEIIYKADFFITFFTGFLFVFSKVAIWHTIVTLNRSVLSPDLASDTIKYMILSSIINMVLEAVSKRDIASRIISGEIGRDMIYPVSLPVVLFFRSMGKAVVALLTRALPALIILTIIYKPHWKVDLVSFVFFAISLFMGFYLYFLVNLLTDSFSFWRVEDFSFPTIKHAVFLVFSGSLIPLWFCPEWFIKMVNFLPFKSIIYSPLEMFFGRISYEECIAQLFINALWMIFMTAIVYAVWKAGIKKVVIHGG